MAGMLLVLAVGVLFSPLPEMKPSEANAGAGASGAAGRRAHQHLPVPAPVAGRAVPVRLRGRGGDGRRCHRHLRPRLRLPLDQTKLFTSFTLGAMLAGYVVGLLLIPRFVSQERYLTVSAVLGVVFCLGAPDARLRLGGLRGRAGLCQRDDVAGDLPAGDPRPGPLHRNRLGAAGDGHRRRRDHSQLFACSSSTSTSSWCSCADGAVLPVHPVLLGVATASGCRGGA
jgi:hypothetical protein